MSVLKWIWNCLFGCNHRHTTWPHRDLAGFDYLCCLDCGKQLLYSVIRMSVVTTEELLQDRRRQAREELGSFRQSHASLRAA